MQKNMNESGDNVVSYSTCGYKYLHDIDIRSSDIDAGTSYGQVFVRMNKHRLIRSKSELTVSISEIRRGRYFFRVNDIDIGAYYIDIGAL